jgi:hypothetical protein
MIFAQTCLLRNARLLLGCVVLNSLKLRDNIGKVPAADRLLLNLMNYAAKDVDKPVSELPADFNDQMSKMGFA